MPKTATWERIEEPRVLNIVLSEATEPEIKRKLTDWIHSAGKSGRVTKGEGEGADGTWFGHGEHPAQDEAAVRKQKREGVAQAVAHMEQSRLEKEPFRLAYTPVQLINDQLVLASLLDDGIQDVKLEGVCLLTSQHMIEEARRICKGGRLGSSLTLVSDWTYKIGCSGWGYGALALTQKHLGPDGMPATQPVLVSLAVGPKEDRAVIACTFSTFLAVMARHNVDILARLRFILMDGTAAGRLAAEKIFPMLTHRLDLQHVVTNVRGLPIRVAGSKENKLYAVSQIQWSSSLPTAMLFHHHWLCVFLELAQKQAYDLIRYLQKEVLYMTDNVWTSSWCGGIHSSVPGHGPHTAQQALERFNRTLKQSLPASYHLYGLQEITGRVESGLRAIAIENGFVRESDESLIFQPADPRVPPKALITDDWLQEPRDEEGNQPKLPPVWRFVEFLPENFMASAVSGAVQDWRVHRIYTYPIQQPGLRIDQESHEKLHRLIAARTPAAFMQAAKDLDLVKQMDLGEMVSVARVRALLKELAMTMVLQHSWYGHTLLCTCASVYRRVRFIRAGGGAFCRDGVCVHILLTRWMEGDPAIKLASVSEYCAKNAIPTVDGAEAALRARLLPQGPLVRRLPTRSAWTTLAALVQQAKARAQKRREQANQTKKKLAGFWHSPNARGPEAAVAADAAERAEHTRRLALTRAVARVQSPAFAVQMDGISDLSSMAMTLQEAQELRADDTVRLLYNDTKTQQAIRLMAKQLLERVLNSDASPPAAEATIAFPVDGLWLSLVRAQELELASQMTRVKGVSSVAALLPRAEAPVKGASSVAALLPSRARGYTAAALVWRSDGANFAEDCVKNKLWVAAARESRVYGARGSSVGDCGDSFRSFGVGKQGFGDGFHHYTSAKDVDTAEAAAANVAAGNAAVPAPASVPRQECRGQRPGGFGFLDCLGRHGIDHPGPEKTNPGPAPCFEKRRSHEWRTEEEELGRNSSMPNVHSVLGPPSRDSLPSRPGPDQDAPKERSCRRNGWDPHFSFPSYSEDRFDIKDCKAAGTHAGESRASSRAASTPSSPPESSPSEGESGGSSAGSHLSSGPNSSVSSKDMPDVTKTASKVRLDCDTVASGSKAFDVHEEASPKQRRASISLPLVLLPSHDAAKSGVGSTPGSSGSSLKRRDSTSSLLRRRRTSTLGLLQQELAEPLKGAIFRSKVPEHWLPPSDAEAGSLERSELGAEATAEVRRWLLGHTSGQQCSQVILDRALTVLSNFKLASGCELEVLGGPLGALVGGYSDADWLFSEVFKKHPSDAIRESFALLGFRNRFDGDWSSTSVEEISLVYRRMCLRGHPSRGGSPKDYLKLQVAMELIKAFCGDAGPLQVDRRIQAHASLPEGPDAGTAEASHFVLSDLSLARELQLSAAEASKEASQLSAEHLEEMNRALDEYILRQMCFKSEIVDEIARLHEDSAYAILGVSSSATDAEIKKAYRLIAMQCHPDKGGDKEDFQELTNAYEKIMEQRRSADDRGFKEHGHENSEGEEPTPVHGKSQAKPRKKESSACTSEDEEDGSADKADSDTAREAKRAAQEDTTLLEKASKAAEEASRYAKTAAEFAHQAAEAAEAARRDQEQGGRETLIKSVAHSAIVYTLTVVKAVRAVGYATLDVAAQCRAAAKRNPDAVSCAEHAVSAASSVH
ncbi:DJA6 [Symbiodinium sp. CCMP2592]|nr:DJA6 [Symbiodinium sp. CCMP2592]